MLNQDRRISIKDGNIENMDPGIQRETYSTYTDCDEGADVEPIQPEIPMTSRNDSSRSGTLGMVAPLK